MSESEQRSQQSYQRENTNMPNILTPRMTNNIVLFSDNENPGKFFGTPGNREISFKKPSNKKQREAYGDVKITRVISFAQEKQTESINASEELVSETVFAKPENDVFQ